MNFIFDDSPSSSFHLEMKKNSKLFLIRRKEPMLSIESVNEFEDLFKFDKKVKKDVGEKVTYVCELKIDGLSVSVIYKEGELKQITTRGDGFLGEEVTKNKFLINDLPLKSDNLSMDFEIRGEVYMKKDEFEKINSDLLKNNIKKLSNPRNAAAGSLRTISFKSSRKRNLNFFSYQFLPKNFFKNQIECLEFLERNEFKVPFYKKCQDIKSVECFIREIEKKRDSLDFSIDGVVIKVNDYEQCSTLGETNKFPK
jgi:DNA ligase (NAD+)